jgi:hypothetical protein
MPPPQAPLLDMDGTHRDAAVTPLLNDAAAENVRLASPRARAAPGEIAPRLNDAAIDRINPAADEGHRP